jgi:hypothetical protein
MSVAYTEQAVVERRKFVTRRKGWWLDKNGRRLVKPGDHLTLCRKVMGRKPGEPLVRLVEVEVVGVRREPLCAVMGPYSVDQNGGTIWPEMIAEGFPDMDPTEFMIRYFFPQGITAMDDVTRIEWRYLDVDVEQPCGCASCDELKRKAALDAGGSFASYICRVMIVCPDCGNKRCPRAAHHDRACAGSNEPGQPGSNY